MARTTLTPKQEAFANAFCELMNATAAYRKVYNTTANDATCRKRASELLANDLVAEKIAEIQAAAAEAAAFTLEDHLDDLLKLRNMAAKKNQFGAAISAEIARGKASGFYVTRIAGHDGGPLAGASVEKPANVDWLGFPLNDDSQG